MPTPAQKVDSYIAKEIPSEFYENGSLDLSKVTQKIGIDTYNASFEGKDADITSGAIQYHEGKWTIYLKDSDTPNRKRFTAAHELGHYISYQCGSFSKAHIDNLDEKENGLAKDFAIYNKENLKSLSKDYEVEANQIAAKLLMPEDAVKKLIAEEKNVEQMAEYFNVPESSMAFRIKSLDYGVLEQMEAGGK